MKPKTATAMIATKLPKARAFYADLDWTLHNSPNSSIGSTPVAVLPFRTLAQARKAVKWARMPLPDKIAALARAIQSADAVGNTPEFAARAILTLTGDLP